MISFPSSMEPQRLRAWRSDPTHWLPIAIDIADGLSLPCEPDVFPTGTNLVVGFGDAAVLKIYPPFLRHQYCSERITLPLLKGRVSVATPEILSEGERDGWQYLVISRLSGELGSTVWPHLPEDQKEDVLRQLGQTMAEVQSAPLGDLASQGPLWSDFLSAQIKSCRSRHIGLGLPAKFLAELDGLIAEAPALIPSDPPAVLLTGEYIPENFLLTSRDGRCELTGLIDFGDVMTGWREYDLLGPGTFMTAGRSGRVQALLQGFGYRPEQLSAALARRLLALMFLHRFSDPLRHICIPGWQDRVSTLDELQHLLWPFDRLSIKSV